MSTEISNHLSNLHSEKIPIFLGGAVFLGASGGMLIYLDQLINMKIVAEIVLSGSQLLGTLAIFYHFRNVDEEKRDHAKWIFLTLLVALIGLNGTIYSQILKAPFYQRVIFSGLFLNASIISIILIRNAYAERTRQKEELKRVICADNQEEIRMKNPLKFVKAVMDGLR